MKVFMINGSPHPNGTTFRALSEIAKTLDTFGIQSEIVTVGDKQIYGCSACGGCAKTGRCVKDDIANEIVEKIIEADGLIIGSPVYYASLNGTLKCLLDRIFYAKSSFANKPAAAVAVARRAGTTATVDEINKYFMISNMPVVPSQYWNMAFGSNGEQVEKDEEGMQTMRTIAKNMAWLLQCIDAGRKSGIPYPEREPVKKTSFIR